MTAPNLNYVVPYPAPEYNNTSNIGIDVPFRVSISAGSTITHNDAVDITTCRIYVNSTLAWSGAGYSFVFTGNKCNTVPSNLGFKTGFATRAAPANYSNFPGILPWVQDQTNVSFQDCQNWYVDSASTPQGVDVQIMPDAFPTCWTAGSSVSIRVTATNVAGTGSLDHTTTFTVNSSSQQWHSTVATTVPANGNTITPSDTELSITFNHGVINNVNSPPLTNNFWQSIYVDGSLVANYLQNSAYVLGGFLSRNPDWTIISLGTDGDSFLLYKQTNWTTGSHTVTVYNGYADTGSSSPYPDHGGMWAPASSFNFTVLGASVYTPLGTLYMDTQDGSGTIRAVEVDSEYSWRPLTSLTIAAARTGTASGYSLRYDSANKRLWACNVSGLTDGDSQFSVLDLVNNTQTTFTPKDRNGQACHSIINFDLCPISGVAMILVYSNNTSTMDLMVYNLSNYSLIAQVTDPSGDSFSYQAFTVDNANKTLWLQGNALTAHGDGSYDQKVYIVSCDNHVIVHTLTINAYALQANTATIGGIYANQTNNKVYVPYYTAAGTNGLRVYSGTTYTFTEITNASNGYCLTVTDNNLAVIPSADEASGYLYYPSNVNNQLTQINMTTGAFSNNFNLNSLFGYNNPFFFMQGISATALVLYSPGMPIRDAASVLCQIDQNSGTVIVHGNYTGSYHYGGKAITFAPIVRPAGLAADACASGNFATIPIENYLVNSTVSFPKIGKLQAFLNNTLSTVNASISTRLIIQLVYRTSLAGILRPLLPVPQYVMELTLCSRQHIISVDAAASAGNFYSLIDGSLTELLQFGVPQQYLDLLRIYVKSASPNARVAGLSAIVLLAAVLVQ